MTADNSEKLKTIYLTSEKLESFSTWHLVTMIKHSHLTEAEM